MKLRLVLIFILLFSTTAMAIESDGVFHIQEDLVVTDASGNITICPPGARVVSGGCFNDATQEAGPQMEPARFLEMFVGPNTQYLGSARDTTSGNAVVLYFNMMEGAEE